MTKKVEMWETELTCPIFDGVFREPVSLSCQHSFCRERLKRSVPGDTQKMCQDIEASGGWDPVITCPVCQSLSDSRINGVERLPFQLTFANKVGKRRCQETVDDEIPKCSICEDEENKSAVNFCTICSTFYCQECMAVMHSMRGALRRHKLITIDEYLVQETTTGTSETTDDVIEAAAQCAANYEVHVGIHAPCQGPLCQQCFTNHDDHRLRDIVGRIKTILVTALLFLLLFAFLFGCILLGRHLCRDNDGRLLYHCLYETF